MKTRRTKQRETVKVRDCPHCGKEHEFDLYAIIEEVLDVMHMMTTRVDSKPCVVTCPNNGATFIVDVPVTLFSGQTLLEVK